MKTLSDYLFNFANLRRSTSKLGVAPHKPILLLAVIDLFEKGLISGAYIEISSALEHAFSQQWDNYVKSAHQKRLATPFYHLSNEGFWTLDTHPNFDEIMKNKSTIDSLNQLKTLVYGAILDDELARLLSDSDSRTRLKDCLIQTYFAD